MNLTSIRCVPCKHYRIPVSLWNFPPNRFPAEPIGCRLRHWKAKVLNRSAACCWCETVLMAGIQSWMLVSVAFVLTWDTGALKGEGGCRTNRGGHVTVIWKSQGRFTGHVKCVSNKKKIHSNKMCVSQTLIFYSWPDPLDHYWGGLIIHRSRARSCWSWMFITFWNCEAKDLCCLLSGAFILHGNKDSVWLNYSHQSSPKTDPVRDKDATGFILSALPVLGLCVCVCVAGGGGQEDGGQCQEWPHSLLPCDWLSLKAGKARECSLHHRCLILPHEILHCRHGMHITFISIFVEVH